MWYNLLIVFDTCHMLPNIIYNQIYDQSSPCHLRHQQLTKTSKVIHYVEVELESKTYESHSPLDGNIYIYGQIGSTDCGNIIYISGNREREK